MFKGFKGPLEVENQIGKDKSVTPIAAESETRQDKPVTPIDDESKTGKEKPVIPIAAESEPRNDNTLFKPQPIIYPFIQHKRMRTMTISRRTYGAVRPAQRKETTFPTKSFQQVKYPRRAERLAEQEKWSSPPTDISHKFRIENVDQSNAQPTESLSKEDLERNSALETSFKRLLSSKRYLMFISTT